MERVNGGKDGNDEQWGSRWSVGEGKEWQKSWKEWKLGRRKESRFGGKGKSE